MGNCQAIDAAALVIQHPCGKIERLYWSITATEVMRLNPGHYVSLIIPLPPPPPTSNDDLNPKNDNKTVRFTRVKLLRPTETLALGHAYRLVTTQEVMKVLKAKKYAKAKKLQELDERPSENDDAEIIDHQISSNCDHNNTIQHKVSEGHGRQRVVSPANNGGVTRSKSWRPSLQSISEAVG